MRVSYYSNKRLSLLAFVVTLFLGLPGLGAGIVAAQAGQMYGHVSDARTFSPIPYAQIFSVSDNFYEVCDVNGYYQFSIPSGVVSIHVYAPGYQLLEVNVSVSEGESTQHDFSLEPEEVWLSQGTVIDCETGQPVSNALVATDTGTYAFTDETGAYNMELPFGFYLVSVWSQGYLIATFEAFVDTSSFDLGQVCLVFEANLSRIFGTVTDSQTGFPIMGAYVSVSDDLFSTVTAFDGFYSMDVPSGAIDLKVEATGYVAKVIPVTLPVGEAVSIALDPVGIVIVDDHCNQPDSCASDIQINGEALEGSIEVAGDVDWFKFQGAAGAEYEIKTSDLGPGSDTVIHLYQENGTTIIVSDDDGGVGLASKIVRTVDQGGLLYVKVEHYYSSSTGTYKISVTGTDDHCNVPGTCATELQVTGQPLSGRIEVGGDTDWFRFTASSGLTCEIETFDLEPRTDTVMSLYRSDGTTLIVENDDGGEGFASRITWAVDSEETFYVVVRHFSQTGTGSYHIRLTGYDDHCNTATSCATNLVPNDTPVQGAFEINEDEDWFQFQCLAGFDYVIETSNLSTAPECDTYLYLVSPDGQIITFDDDGGQDLASSISWQADTDGIFYILAKHYHPQGRGVYSIALTVTWAALLQINDPSVPGNIEFGGDLDIFFFSAETGRSYVIETGNLSEDCDTIIKLYGPDGFLMAQDDDSGEDHASRITFMAMVPGTHYVVIKHYNEDTGTGTYEIRVWEDEDDDHSDSPDTEATLLQTDSSQISGRFESPGDEDWFSVEAVANQRYVIETGNLAGNCDTVMEIYSADGSTMLAQDDDSGDGFASLIEWSAPSTGIFYIRLRHFSLSGTGSYSICVRTLSSDDYSDIAVNATPVIIDDPPVSGQINIAGDVDWFQFQAVHGIEYIIETSNLDDQCDTVISLYCPDGSALIDTDDDRGDGLGSRIVWIADTSGTYYVRVRHFSSGGTGAYDLSIQQIAHSCTPVNPDQPTTGALEQGGSELYCLAVNEGDQVTVTLNGPQSGADIDLYLRLGSPPTLSDYDVRGFTSASQESCDLTVSSSAALYIWVRSFSGPGEYSVEANLIPYQPPGCLTLNEDIPQSGVLSGAGDGELYCLEVAEGDQVLIMLDGPDIGADFDLYLKHGSPPTFHNYEARGYSPFSDEIVSLSDLTSGTLYIWVVSYSGDGNYSLEAQIAHAQTGCIPLTESQAQADSLSFSYDEQLYCFDVSEGDQIRVSLTGPASAADFDLYLKLGSSPTLSDYDVGSWTSTSQEECLFTSTSAGRVYVWIWSYFGSGDYTIQVELVSRTTMAKRSHGLFKPIIKGRIVDKLTGQGMQPNSFCIAIKDMGKFCYNTGSVATSQVSFIPGGYFLFMVDQLAGDYTLSITDIPCYFKSDPTVYREAGLSNVVFELEIDPDSDCDGDGMSNDWEKRHGLNIWKNDTSLDLDEDGYSNVEEYNASSQPNNKDSIPQESKFGERGDINGDGKTDLVDGIIALKVIARIDSTGLIRSEYATSDADVNGDNRIGMEEVIYIMQKVAGLRD